MKPITVVTALLALAACVASCASPAKLARQSDEALAHGDLSKAYDRALRAVEMDPQNAAAREAYSAAATRVAADYRRRVLATAAADTLSAADLALTFRSFRLEVARHGSALPESPDYEAAEPVLLESAARTHYRAGRSQMTQHRPRVAYREFVACQRYVPTFADAARRQDQAWVQASVRVAVLPFADGIGVPGLSPTVAQGCANEIGARLAKDFRFTLLVPADSVERQMTLAQSRDLARDDARAIGRRLGADLVVVGHLAGMHSTDSSREPVVSVYHRVEHKDDQGNTVVSWRDGEMRLVIRDRQVVLRYDFDVLDLRTGVVVSHREKEARAGARVAWTSYRPDDDADHYALLPPDVRSAEPARARQVDAAWKDQMGSWTLPELMRAAQGDRDRSRYSSRYRGEFRGDSHQHPVWMGELPGEGELAYVALESAWRPVYEALLELDRVE